MFPVICGTPQLKDSRTGRLLLSVLETYGEGTLPAQGLLKGLKVSGVALEETRVLSSCRGRFPKSHPKSHAELKHKLNSWPCRDPVLKLQHQLAMNGTWNSEMGTHGGTLGTTKCRWFPFPGGSSPSSHLPWHSVALRPRNRKPPTLRLLSCRELLVLSSTQPTASPSPDPQPEASLRGA